MNFDSKFGAWVSFHTASLQSWKIQENLGRTVVVLPLLAPGCMTIFFIEVAIRKSLEKTK